MQNSSQNNVEPTDPVRWTSTEGENESPSIVLAVFRMQGAALPAALHYGCGSMAFL